MLPADLKKAREEKRLSLYDVAEATLIDIRFLQAIEDGDFSVLPQAYIRAFIKEYAAVVGLDQDETIRKYEKETASRHTPAREPELPGEAQVSPEAPAVRLNRNAPSATLGMILSQHAAKLSVIGFVVAIIIVSFLNLTHEQDRKDSPPESSFDRVVHENEERAGVTPASVNPDAATPRPVVHEDSLRLRGVTSDSVWVEVVIDSQSPRQHLLRPNAVISWIAKDRFLLTVGNAGAIDFTLNQKHLGTLGKSGVVARNIELSRQRLLEN